MAVRSTRRGPARGARLAVALAALCLIGCTSAKRIALKPFYTPVELPDAVEVVADVLYRNDVDVHPEKHTLDFYRPQGTGWPVVVFLHGGSFIKGDKDLEVGGHDVYGNIARFYASRGYGVALVNYRLQPEATWLEQLDDAGAAVAWVMREAARYGAGDSVVLMGHSAGAWMAARLVFDRDVHQRHGFDESDVAGVIVVSGSGFDLRDEETWRIYRREDWWAERFQTGDPELDWHEVASVVPLIDGDEKAVPPFLQIHSTRENQALQRQNRLLNKALLEAGFSSEVYAIDRHSHRRIVLALSRPDIPVSDRVLAFLAERHL